VLLLTAHRPALVGPPGQVNAGADTSGNEVRDALDALSEGERAELRRVIDAVLDEARAEGRLADKPPHDHTIVAVHQRPLLHQS
jgi:hypothetical protein